jgi:hypothetical protein
MNLNDSGAGSLRQAVIDANAAPAADDIDFDASVTEILLASPISITANVNIKGPGKDKLAISGSNVSRIFEITGVVTIDGLTLKDANPATGNGGAIYTTAASQLTLTNSTLSNNRVSGNNYGGAIYTVSGSSLTITDCTFSGNSTGASGYGGAIAAAGSSITITKSTLENNAAYGGGAIYYQSGALSIIDSLLSDNSASTSAGYGGAIYAYFSPLIITRSILTDNAAYHGGAIYNTNSLNITDSVLSDNLASASGYGGAIYDYVNSTLARKITNSTLSGNFAGQGGAIFSLGGPDLTITNSTLSGNSANYGGAITSSNSLIMTNSTLSNNWASIQGGAIYSALSNLKLGNNLISGNTSPLGKEVYGPFTSQGNNLFGEYNSSGVAGGGAPAGSDLILDKSWSTAIDPLADNGGPTQTHRLAAGSWALEAGNDALIPSGITTDQRGVARIQGTHVDIGALEMGGFLATATAGTGGAITPPTQTVDPGVTANFTVTPATGYSVASVTGCGGTWSGSNPYTTAAMIADCAVTASFSLNSYTVSATAGANGAITPPSTMVSHGSTTTFTVTPATNYSASVTGCNGTLTGNAYVTGAIIAPCTVAATFTLGSLTVTALAGANGAISPPSQTVAPGATASFAVTPSSGYTVNSILSTCGGNLIGATFTTGPVNSACTVTASFSPSGYTVTAMAGANGSISPPSATVNHGSTTTFTVTPSPGYVASVISNCGGSLSGTTYITGPITGACTVTASFSPSGYTVTAMAGANGAISPPSQTVTPGATVSFAVTPSSGYTVNSILSTCGGNLIGAAFTTGPVSSACTVTASFSPSGYTVTAIAGANGSISPASQTVAPGAATTFTVTPNAGYTAVVTGCRGTLSGNTYATGPITGACTVTASFTRQTYAVTATAGVNGRISPASQTIPQGATTSFTVTPDPGYAAIITSTCGGALSGNTYTTGPVTSACTVNANFTRNTNNYTVSASADLNGSIGPVAQTIRYGYTATFLVTPDPGYIASVTSTCGGALIGNTYTTNPVTADCQVTASFNLSAGNSYTVTANADLEGSVNPVAQVVSHGHHALFTVMPDDGYFASVSGCGGALAGHMYTTGPVTADCAVTASFSENPSLTTPALTLPAPPSAIAGVPYGAILTVSGGHPPYTYHATGLPDGLRLDPDGVLAGTPTEGGSFNAHITVTDGLGQTGERDYPLTVADRLALVTSHLPDGLVDTPYHQVLKAIGGHPPYRYTAVGLPTGLSLDPDGALTGALLSKGDTTIQITISDDWGETVTQMLALTVREATFTRPNPAQPEQTISTSVTPPAGTTCDVASTETYTLNLGDPDAPTTGPDGIDLPYGLLRIVVRGCTAGQTVLAFTTVYPQPLPPGTQYWKYGRTAEDPTPHWYVMPGAIVQGNTVTFLIVDGGVGDDDLEVNADITDPGGPGLPNLAIRGKVAASSPLSSPYRVTLQARYGSSPMAAMAATPQTEAAYLWSVNDGALPPGLTLDGSADEAVLSGAPTQVGVYPFTLQVIDRAQGNALTQQTYRIEITDSDPAIALITHYYVSILDREPEAEGLAFWQGQIAEKQAQGLDVKPVFRDMANFFFNSPEYLAKNTTNVQFLFNLYLTFFQREPDDGGLAFWLTQLLEEGVPRHEVMAGFLYSPEFTDFMEGLGL